MSDLTDQVCVRYGFVLVLAPIILADALCVGITLDFGVTTAIVGVATAIGTLVDAFFGALPQDPALRVGRARDRSGGSSAARRRLVNATARGNDGGQGGGYD